MRIPVAGTVIVGVLTLAPPAAFAASPAGQSNDTSKANKTSHATAGIVKTVEASSLVISRAGSAGEMTFTLNPARRREGTIDVGTPVSVRYRETGNTHIATAVMALTAHQSGE